MDSKPAYFPAHRRPLSAAVPPVRRAERSAVADHAVPAATVSAVIDEAARDVLDEVEKLVPSGTHARYVPPPSGRCPPSLECLPLAPLLGTDPAITGHLHRPVAPIRAAAAAIDDEEFRHDPPPVPLVPVGRMIAATVRRDLLDVELVRSQHEVSNLSIALETNRTIGVAIGVLMATLRCTAAHALDVLKKASQVENRKLRDVAADVQLTGAAPATTSTRRRA